MNRHTGRFVDYDDILVFINDVQWNLNRRDLFGIFCLADDNLKDIFGSQYLAQIMYAIDKNTFGHAFDFSKILSGIPSAS